MHSAHRLSTVSLVDDHVVDIGSRSLTCKSSENEGCLNAVGHYVVILTSDCGLVCGAAVRQSVRPECEALSGTGCELVTGQSCDKRVLNHETTQGGVDSAPLEVEHHCDQDVASSVRGLEESFQVWYGNIREDHLSV